jgi:predicted nucleotide-binding protein (sugar kinase/HSP70/actin superfamily)
MPWNARSAVLTVVRYSQEEFDTSKGTYNCTKVCDAPHAAENAMKITRESDTMSLLPKISLNFAKMTRTPEIGEPVFLAKASVGFEVALTSIAKKITGIDPSYAIGIL